MPNFLIAWEADENDNERDDVCPRCGEYLPKDPFRGLYRYSCGDCWGGTERDPQARSWEQAAGPFDPMN